MRYALAQTLLRRSRSAVAAAFDGLATCTYFHCASGFLHPQTRIYHKLLGPCFKTIELLEILAKSPLWNPQAKAATLLNSSDSETWSFVQLNLAVLT